MLRHTIETCPDDLSLLQRRLDELSAAGARIVTVLWQQRRVVEENQSAAFDASGSFVIISEEAAPAVLRESEDMETANAGL
jgi:hypothetical protein